MQEPLPSILPPIQNAALAMGVLFLAHLLTIPLRRLYPARETIDVQRRSGVQFLGVLLSHPAFSVVVILLSIPVRRWVYHPCFYHADVQSPAGAMVERPYDHAWLLFWGISAVVRLIEGLLVEGFAQMGRACPLSRLSRGVLRLAILLGVAFLLIRYQLGHEIGVLLTSTAIVTGVVGIAMQGVLGNLLAGMSLHACRSLAVGDWIEIDGLVAQVVQVSWRETRVRSAGHIYIVPNAKVAATTLRNFSIPNTLRRHAVTVSVSYANAPVDVIATLLEAADSVPEVEKQPAPDAYITGFKDVCVQYVLRFWSKHYELSTVIQGNVMRMIWYKFNRRGIEIPFPVSGRMFEDLMRVAQPQRFEKRLDSEVERTVKDLVLSDFGSKLMADSKGACMLGQDDLRAVARDVKRVRFTYGENIMRQNEAGESFYVLVQGIVKGNVVNSGAALPIEFELQPGALFGEMSLLTGLPRSATMTAATNCEMLEFDRDAFSRLLSLQERIPHALSDLAAARAAENAASLENSRASTVAPHDLARDGILHRLKRMLGERRDR